MPTKEMVTVVTLTRDDVREALITKAAMRDDSNTVITIKEDGGAIVEQRVKVELPPSKAVYRGDDGHPGPFGATY